MYTYTINIQ